MLYEFTTADGKGIKVDAPTYEEAQTAAALELKVPPDELLYQPPKAPPNPIHVAARNAVTLLGRLVSGGPPADIWRTAGIVAWQTDDGACRAAVVVYQAMGANAQEAMETLCGALDEAVRTRDGQAEAAPETRPIGQ